MLLTDVIDELDILADQLEQEAKKTTVYKVELAPEIRNRYLGHLWLDFQNSKPGDLVWVIDEESK